VTISIGAIDDDEAILYTLKAMAENQNWEMHTTTSCEDVISWIQRKEIDILLVDYHMPQINGAEVIKRCRKISKEVVILVLTIEEDQKIARNLLLIGADDFVLKPIRLVDFASRITLHGRFLNYRRNSGLENLNKGIHQDTLRIILLALGKIGNKGATIQDIAQKTDLSYPTAHRYLEYLEMSGLVSKEPKYQDGRSGRPRFIYYLLDSCTSLNTPSPGCLSEVKAKNS
jgi:response regulator of citrate/malate metabolism